MFAKRLFSSIVLWAVLLTVLFYTNKIGTLPSAIVCCLIAILAQSEFYDMLEKGGLRCSKVWGLFGGVVLCSGVWFFSAIHPQYTSTFEVIFVVTMVISLLSRQLFNPLNPDTIQTTANTLLGLVYVPWLFCFLPKIKYLFGADGPGWLFVFYTVVVTKFCDIGAYVTGRLFGRHKMIPRISPNKTWEGIIGGIAISVAASVATFKYLEYPLPRISQFGFSYYDSLIVGVLLAVLGAAGDLIESLFKRETRVKDSGGVLPGIGGALDLIDSLLFTAPILYVYLVLFVRAP
jgi:phosphatidate cytidylyltransferase